jgi:hypothetical protein
MDDGSRVPGYAWYLDAQDTRQSELRVEGLVDGFQTTKMSDWFGNVDPLAVVLVVLLVFGGLAAFVLS